VIENKEEKRKYGHRVNFYINLHLKDDLRMKSTAC